MVRVVDAESFWVILAIHAILLLECAYFRMFRTHKSSKIHSSSHHNNRSDHNIPNSPSHIINPYLKYPKLSWPVLVKCIKLNHLFIKTFIRNYSLQDRILEVISNCILLIGILGVTGTEFKAWPSVNFVAAGLLGGTLGRLFHSWYMSLQVKQKRILNDFSSNNKLVRMVEAEVIKRINFHRIMRRFLGYFIMILYYAVNLYYCIQFIVEFNISTNHSWMLSFLIAFVFEYFMLEVGIVMIKIQALTYLKAGGFEIIETACRVVLDDEFLKTFN